jgi:[acyl-carrier-protein] S-malonyltransferase
MTHTICVFPGQGSQKVGMGKEMADNFATARDVFAEVDDALNQKLSRIIFEGSESDLTLTENAQPAIMATSIAVLRVLEAEAGFNLAKAAAYVAGHSLGEYSALCAAGALSLRDTARLLKLRGQAMQRAVPAGEGAMAAIIGLDMESVTKVTEAASAEGVCEVANDNSDGQVVISGAAAAIERAMELAKEAGAKRALPLPVSAPFHCSLMKPAADEMRAALAAATILNPAVPLIANVTAAPVQDAAAIRDLLVEQVTGRVRWRESVEWMANNAIVRAIEMGEGKVLSGLIRRIASDIECSNVSVPADIESIMAAA